MRPPRGGAPSIDRLNRDELSIMSIGLFALVGVLALRVRGSRLPLRVDRVGSGLVDSIRAPRHLAVGILSLGPGSFGRVFVAWGTIVVAAVLAVCLALVAWRRGDRWAALLSFVAPALAVALVDGLAKPLVDRHHGHGPGLAFPSGHAAVAAAAATLVLVLVNRWYGWRRALCSLPVAALLPVAVGTAVVRLGWHYPTDVVGGVAFGAAVVVALAAAIPGPLRARL